MAADIRLPDIKSAVKMDTKDVDAGLNRVQSATKSASSGFESFGARAKGSLDGIKAGLKGMATFDIADVSQKVVRAGFDIAKMSIDAASDLAESQSKVGQVFGDSAKEIEAFASTAARSFGLSKQAALEATGTFGNLFRSMGVGLPEATAMSKGLVTLAADLASFNNIDPTVALEKLRSGLVGEIEPLRALGVNFNAAEVNAKAMALGLGQVGVELTDQAKVQARYALILEKTQLAQGDFGRTSDGLANQQRILKAQVEDLSAELGKALIPAMTQLGQVIIPVVSGMTSLTEKAGGLGRVLGAVGTGLNPLVGILELLPGKQKKSSDAADVQKTSAEGLTGATDDLTTATKGSSDAATDAATASEKHATALNKVKAAVLSGISSQLGYEASVNTLKDNIADLDDKTKEYNDAVEKNGVNSKEAETANRALRDAHLGIETSAVSAANAAVRLADDQATAAGKSLDAKQKADIFRDALVELAGQAEGPTKNAILALADQVIGLPNHKTVTIDADITAAQNKLASIQRQINSVSSGAYSTSGAQQFAAGLDMGPVKGRPGQAVPIIAHAGEWVVTPSQLADLRRSPSPGVPSATATGQAIDYNRLAAAIAAHPPRAYVVASDVAKGLHDIRRR